MAWAPDKCLTNVLRYLRGHRKCCLYLKCQTLSSYFDSWCAYILQSLLKLEGTSFDIDCSEGEFADYDEKGECPVGVGKLRSEFRVVSKQAPIFQLQTGSQ